MQQKNEALDRNMSEVVTEIRHLKEPLAMANNEVTEMRAKTDDYDNMKSIMQVSLLGVVFCFSPHNYYLGLCLLALAIFTYLFICLMCFICLGYKKYLFRHLATEIFRMEARISEQPNQP